MTALRPGASPPPVEMAIRRSVLSLSVPLSDQAQHLTRARVPTDALLGKHQVVIELDIEHAAGGLNQLDLGAGQLPA
jgi:hypothetical protein